MLPFRLALYLVSSDAAPGSVLEAVADEMKGLLPLIFGAMHVAISAGGTATGDFCMLQAQLLQRTTTSGTLDLPIPLTGAMPPSAERRGPPLGLLPQPHLHNHQLSHLQPNSSVARSPGSAPPKSPRTGSGGANSPSAIRRGSIGGVGSASRLRLASPGMPPPQGGGGGMGCAGAALESNADLSLSSAMSNERHDGVDGGGTDEGTGGGGGGGAAAAGSGGGGGSRRRPLLQENMDDLVISSSSQIKNFDVGNSAPNLNPGGNFRRKISAPCYMISSPVLRLEDVVGPRPLELLVSSARNRLTTVAAGSDAGEEARSAVAQDLAAVDLHEVIGSGGQGVVFRGTLHGLETAVKVWEHNGRAPLEHDGEWLSAEALDGGGGGSHQAHGADGPQGGGGAGGAEAVVSSRDCIRQAKRGAMEVAVTVTLSHPNVVQPYAHFSDVVVVERQPANSPPPGSPNPGPLQLRLCAHDDPVFRGQKAGPLNTVLCLEYCDAGTLLSAARRGDFRLADSGPRDGPVWPDLVPLYTSLLEVALALRYLHSRRLVHCDLKPGNVLLKTSTRDPRGWTCKLSDFGCVRLMDESSPEGVPGFRMAQVFGTVAYMAPECFSRGRLLGVGVDVFAFGILMWELMHCKPPHAGIDPKELPRLVARSNLRPEFHPLAPHEYRALACSCWATSPDRRPSATQLVAQLHLLLGTAKATSLAQQQQHRRHQLLHQQQSPSPARPAHQPSASPHGHQYAQQQQSPQQLGFPQLSVQQKRQLLRFPSAQSEGRLCERVVKEQAHQALAQQVQYAQQRGGGAGGGDGGDASPTLRQLSQMIGSLGSCGAEPLVAPPLAAASGTQVGAPGYFDGDRHSFPKQPLPLQHQRNSVSGINPYSGGDGFIGDRGGEKASGAGRVALLAAVKQPAAVVSPLQSCREEPTLGT
ncbi:hypothetical protein VaNZ11_005566 [Volvox africanus]|uniref:Protein kinase domain-containing protein n=1 Tax=Volvox africanus TaxID=51714 RepID=A0ABQ5RYV9_9CHLO|nr:hypothetical protein VaNZ11_005566 [Volvox africanus]